MTVRKKNLSYVSMCGFLRSGKQVSIYPFVQLHVRKVESLRMRSGVHVMINYRVRIPVLVLYNLHGVHTFVIFSLTYVCMYMCTHTHQPWKKINKCNPTLAQ